MKLHTTIVDVTARDRAESKRSSDALAVRSATMKGIALMTTLTPNGRMSARKVERAASSCRESREQLGALTTSFDQLDDAAARRARRRRCGVAQLAGGRAERHEDDRRSTRSTLTRSPATRSVRPRDRDPRQRSDDHGRASMTVDIKDIAGTGGGKGTIDLRHARDDERAHRELRSKMQSPGEAQATPMKMHDRDARRDRSCSARSAERAELRAGAAGESPRTCDGGRRPARTCTHAARTRRPTAGRRPRPRSCTACTCDRRIEHAVVVRRARPAEVEARAGAARETREVRVRAGVIRAARLQAADVRRHAEPGRAGGLCRAATRAATLWLPAPPPVLTSVALGPHAASAIRSTKGR